MFMVKKDSKVSFSNPILKRDSWREKGGGEGNSGGGFGFEMKPEKGSEGGRAIKNELWPRKRREGGRSVTYHLLGERRKGGKLNFTPKLAEETKIKRFRLHYRNFFWGDM